MPLADSDAFRDRAGGGRGWNSVITSLLFGAADSLTLDARASSEKSVSLLRVEEKDCDVSRVRKTEKRRLEREAFSSSIVFLQNPKVTVEKHGPKIRLRSSVRDVSLVTGRASMDTRTSPF